MNILRDTGKLYYFTDLKEAETPTKTIQERFSVTCNVGTPFCQAICVETGYVTGKCVKEVCYCYHEQQWMIIIKCYNL